jgi:hypothetical protein
MIDLFLVRQGNLTSDFFIVSNGTIFNVYFYAWNEMALFFFTREAKPGTE